RRPQPHVQAHMLHWWRLNHGAPWQVRGGPATGKPGGAMRCTDRDRMEWWSRIWSVTRGVRSDRDGDFGLGLAAAGHVIVARALLVALPLCTRQPGRRRRKFPQLAVLRIAMPGARIQRREDTT